MAKIDLISNEWADIVFQGRNKVYGRWQNLLCYQQFL